LDQAFASPEALAARAAPERSGIDAVGIEGEHTIVKFLGGRSFVLKPYEVLNVAARFLYVPRRVIRIEGAMTDDDRPRIQRFDFIDGGEPIVKALSIAFHEVRMRAVVDGVARDDEANRWHMKACGVIGIGVPDIQGNDRVAFKTEGAIVEWLGRNKTSGDHSWKSPPPILNGIGCECSLHALHHLRQCNRAGRRKAIAQKL
jgi:hypothetical protein